MLEVRQVMDRIEDSLDSGTYCVGDWQKCVNELKRLGQDSTLMLSQDLTRISNKLHRRNQYPEAPMWTGLALEYLLLVMSMLAMTAESTSVRLASIIALALCLQPLIKISMGMLLGVRYAYVYLWYIEPRFKMRFGTYHHLARWKKLILQLAGSVGTPVALLVGWRVLGDAPMLSMLCLAGALTAALMQVTAFTAVWLGVRKVGPFLLTNLTTPALLAKELKEK